jgi:hypothetical protein
METYRESDAGYPEEAPPEVVPEDEGRPDRSSVRESARPDTSDSPSNDDGRATGNPDAAGGGEEPAAEKGVPGGAG